MGDPAAVARAKGPLTAAARPYISGRVKFMGTSMVGTTNILTKLAYDDGAEYSYRVNDDTWLKTPNWMGDLSTALKNMSPPNIGAVGPTTKRDFGKIMTYDFLHRSHFEIFGYRYPPVFKNWYCDNWITSVYGDKTRKLAPVKLLHTRSTDHTRYKIDLDGRKKLEGEIVEGK